MITLTTEQAQQIEEALLPYAYQYVEMGAAYTVTKSDALVERALTILRAARAQEQAEQPVSQEYQDHLVNQSFDWAAMAAKHQFMEGYRIGLAEMREKCAKVCDDIGDSDNGYGCAAAIRDINFEGDTGFRPVSEMVAEHKQDPKKAAAIEKAKMRKAEQEPVALVFVNRHGDVEITDYTLWQLERGHYKLYTHPVRTKDLTDDEIDGIANNHDDFAGRIKVDHVFDFARAVIAADREKNK